MKKLYTLTLALCAGFMAWAGEVTDVISASTITIPTAYEQQEATLTSDAVYLITVKDSGDGTPQFKAGSSGIVTKESGGKVARVEVAWGSKSNEGVAVYGSALPYAASDAVIDGTLLGTIEFSAGSTVGLDIEGDWEFIGITSTAEKGKACQVGSISITWTTNDAAEDEPCKGVIINEVCGDDGSDSGEDWIELYNPTDGTLDLSGVNVVKVDEDGIAETLCVIADGVTLAPGEYYVLEKGADFTAGISNQKPVTIQLYSPLEVRLGMFDKNSTFGHNASHRVGGSYSLTADGWAITDEATKGAANVVVINEIGTVKSYTKITNPIDVTDGQPVLVAFGPYFMGYDWDTTKDGGVYLQAVSVADEANDTYEINAEALHLAPITLVDGGDGTWALLFGETENYLTDSQYLACTAFKNLKFKKKDDPTKGTRCTIALAEDGAATIDYGEGGWLMFNFKDGGDSRFFNYDPTDKPEEHDLVYFYTLSENITPTGIIAVGTEVATATEYYNLQGIRVANPRSGELVIERCGNTARTIIVK